MRDAISAHKQRGQQGSRGGTMANLTREQQAQMQQRRQQMLQLQRQQQQQQQQRMAGNGGGGRGGGGRGGRGNGRHMTQQQMLQAQMLQHRGTGRMSAATKKQKRAMQEATLQFNPNTPPSNLMLCFTREEILNHIKVLRDEFSAVFSAKEIKNRLMPVLTTLMTDPDGERLFCTKVDPSPQGYALPDYNLIVKVRAALLLACLFFFSLLFFLFLFLSSICPLFNKQRTDSFCFLFFFFFLETHGFRHDSSKDVERHD